MARLLNVHVPADEQATMLLSLDHRIKIAFAECWIACWIASITTDCPAAFAYMGDVARLGERLAEGEVSESLLGEMQALTASMKGGGDGR